MATIIVPNAVAIVLGALGLITPGIATLANNGSTIVAGLIAMAPLLRGAPNKENR
jgi:cation transport ATPase